MRRGGQLPTFEVVGNYAYTDAQAAIEMFEAYGRRYYDSQKYEMELLYARKEDGTYATNSIGITKPRQNGKSFCSRDYALDMACMGDGSSDKGKRVLFSAHHGRTVRAMFKEMCDFIESHEDFRNELDYIYKAGGYEGIYFGNGGCIEFQTRTNSGGRGGTYDIVIVDEAQEMTTAQQEALIPVVSAAQEIGEGTGTQVIYLGTVPSPECPGTVFKDMHDRAHSGDTNMWWLEWGAQGQTLDDVDIDDVDLWYACNSAMGRRMSLAAVQNERDTMSPDGFARERLGWWPAQSTSAVIKENEWKACATAERPSEGVYSYAVKFSYFGDTCCVSTCLKASDEKMYIGVAQRFDMGDGMTQIVDFVCGLKDKAARITVDGGSNVQPFIDELIRRGFPRKLVWKARPIDVSSACSALLSAIREANVHHFNQETLNDSALKSKRRKIGSDGWGFGDNDCDAIIIESCAIAYWGAFKAKKATTRKQRMAF